MSNTTKKLTLAAFILMMLTSVFGVTNIGIGFYRMGYAAIPMFTIGGLLYFIPYIMMMVELATGFKGETGGIYTWMEKSVSVKFAFIGIMMWYSSYVIWMFGKALSLWVPLSFAVFGTDITTTPVMIGETDFGPFLLGVVGILVILLMTKIVSAGAGRLAKITSIGGIAVISLNVVLLVGGIFAISRNLMDGHIFKETLDAAALYTSPNPDYQSVMPFFGFIVFAVFAYGGTEAIAGVASDLENPERDLKRGIFLSGAFIVIAYIIGFFMVGAALEWSQFGEGVSSLSALFLIMGHLGDAIVGSEGSMLGDILTRFAGLGMFLSYVGALVALSYAPLKQMIDGAPEEFWPESFKEVNPNGVRVAAVKIQAYIVIIFIAAKSVFSLIDPDGANALYELIISMTNVGMTIPYVFLIIAWYKFRKNDELEKDVILIKSDAMVLFCLVSTMVLVIFGNAFTIISPFLSGDLQTGIWTVIGPVIFSIIALAIYSRGEKKINNK
ncbi:glutamate/gamma-aminobutyrate family transporter YjeM [Mollicutes bacterium LVI A0078]|nr:glutamate/gamma-aminobutyrate family transporter YjeM [Mollicutes bacterium LVI A0078]